MANNFLLYTLVPYYLRPYFEKGQYDDSIPDVHSIKVQEIQCCLNYRFIYFQNVVLMVGHLLLLIL